MDNLVLSCWECDAIVTVDSEQRMAIVAELTRASHRKIIDCRCGKFQFILEAGSVPERLGAAGTKTLLDISIRNGIKGQNFGGFVKRGEKS